MNTIYTFEILLHINVYINGNIILGPLKMLGNIKVVSVVYSSTNLTFTFITKFSCVYLIHLNISSYTIFVRIKKDICFRLPVRA